MPTDSNAVIVTLSVADDTYTVGDGNYVITNPDGNDTINTGAGNSIVNALSGNNIITMGAGNSTVNSGGGDDTINTGAGISVVHAGAGHNTITTGAGGSTVITTDGNSTITTGAGGSVVTAGTGNNTITTGAGGSIINTLVGNNTITAGDGDNVIHTLGGNNTVTSGNGNDVITTMAGNDTITAGAGNDVISSGAGNDTVYGGAGNDVLVYVMAENNSLAAAYADIYQGGTGIDTFRMVLTSAEYASVAVQADIANFKAFMALNTGLDGEAGTASFTFASITMIAGSFEKLEIVVDGVTVFPAPQALNTAAVIGGVGTGMVTAGTPGAPPPLTGGQLTISDVDPGQSGFQPQATTAGSNGFGSFTFDANGHWTYQLGTGAAVITLANGEQATDTLTIHSLDGTTSQITVTVTGVNEIAAEANAVNLTLSLANDTFTVGAGNYVITNLGGNDTINTGAGNSIVNALSGNNIITMGAGNNSVNTGGGDDTINTGAGISVIQAGAGNNTITTGAGGSSVFTTDGNSTITTGAGGSVVTAGTGNNTITTGAGGSIITTLVGNNTITAGDGDSVIRTLGGNNTITSSNGNDHITTMAGNDTITAGAGDDVISSGAGNDTVYGGTGNDVLVYVMAENKNSTVAYDDIFQGGTGIDTLRLVLTTAEYLSAGVQADIANFKAFMALNTGLDGEASPAAFTFASFSLLAGSFEKLEIIVDGVSVYPANHAASFGGVGTGAVTAGTPAAPAPVIDGQLTVTDADPGQSSFQPLTAAAGTLGSFSIDATGHWTYQLGTSAAVQALTAGEQTTDTFTVYSLDGTPSQITVTITGVDDVASFGGVGTGAVTAGTAAAPAPAIEGQLTVSDPDHDQSGFQPQAAAAGTLGSFSIDATGHWTYQLGTSAVVQALTAGEQITDTLTVYSLDGTPSQITVTITGVNDVASFGGVGTGAVTAGTPAAPPAPIDGQLTVSDPDHGQSGFQPQTGAAGTLGSFSIDATGHWTYQLGTSAVVQALTAGEQTTDIFTVYSLDGTPTQITVTITGVNDAASIGGVGTGAVTAGTPAAPAPVIGGQLTVSDPDHDQSSFQTETDAVAEFGSFNLDGAGHWTYQLGTSAAVRALTAGEQITDTLTVYSLDGTPSQITVTITGVNDAASIGGVGTGAVTAGTPAAPAPAIDGQLTVSDPDHGQSGFQPQTATAGTLGSFSIDATGHWTYQLGTSAVVQALTAGEQTTDTLTVYSLDGTPSEITVTITGHDAGVIEVTNRPPVASDDSGFVHVGSALTVAVLANDSDPDGNALSLGSVGTAAHGHVVMNTDGTVTYTANAGFAGADSFSYTVQDSAGAAATGTVSLVVGYSDHDKVGGDVFLQGNYIEMGVSSAGTLGTASRAPGNYHPMDPSNLGRIALVADLDGWGTGIAPVAGDFTLPGDPTDTIVLGVSGVSYAQAQRMGKNDIASSTVDMSHDDVLASLTTGVAGGVKMTQLIELDTNATYYKTTITVENLSAATVTDVRFLRSFDPDQDYSKFGTYQTLNDVLSNPTAGNDLAIARATGTNSGISVNLVAFDTDSRASNYGFLNYDAYAPEAFATPLDGNGAAVDRSITLEMKFGNLAVGAQLTKVFYTSLNGNQGADDMTIGSAGADVLNAGMGNDILIGLTGNDILTGGAGNDHFVFSQGSGADTITDFKAGAGSDDVIDLRGFAFNNLNDVMQHVTQDGADVTIDLGGGDSIKLIGVDQNQLHADDFAFFH